MRRIFLIAFLAGSSLLALESSASAQFVNPTDPMFLYYSYYLPRQQVFQSQADSGPGATLDALAGMRQESMLQARAQRPTLDLFANSLDQEIDPTAPFSARGARQGRMRSRRVSFNMNISGHGSPMYHGGARRYYPTVRRGYGPNHNLAVIRSRGRGSRGGGGMGGGMSMGFPR